VRNTRPPPSARCPPGAVAERPQQPRREAVAVLQEQERQHQGQQDGHHARRDRGDGAEQCTRDSVQPGPELLEHAVDGLPDLSVVELQRRAARPGADAVHTVDGAGGELADAVGERCRHQCDEPAEGREPASEHQCSGERRGCSASTEGSGEGLQHRAQEQGQQDREHDAPQLCGQQPQPGGGERDERQSQAPAGQSRDARADGRPAVRGAVPSPVAPGRAVRRTPRRAPVARAQVASS